MTLSSVLDGLRPLAAVYCILGVGALFHHFVMTRWKAETETYTLKAPDGKSMRVTVSTALTPEERGQVLQEALTTLAARK